MERWEETYSGKILIDKINRVVELGQEKGYVIDKAPFALNDLISGAASSPAHSIGEAIYKLLRYLAKGNADDLVKAGAWVVIAWRWHTMNKTIQQKEFVHLDESVILHTKGK